MQLNQAVSGLAEGQRQPLRGFTRQESFTAGGRAGPLCGQSCDLARRLTSSEEPCLDRANARTDCPAAFEQLPPFSDLTYRAR